MAKPQGYYNRTLEWAHKVAAATTMLVTLFLGVGIGTALIELLWPDHTAWVLVILVPLVLLLFSTPTLVIWHAGLKSASYAYVGLLFVGCMLLIDIFSRSMWMEIWVREFGNTTEGVITDRRTEPGRRHSTNYYVDYEFSVEGESGIYTQEQNTHPDRYGRLEIGSAVEIVYLPFNPTESFLKEGGFLKDSLSMFLGFNFASLFLFPGLLLVDKLFGRIGQIQQGSV